MEEDRARAVERVSGEIAKYAHVALLTEAERQFLAGAVASRDLLAAVVLAAVRIVVPVGYSIAASSWVAAGRGTPTEMTARLLVYEDALGEWAAQTVLSAFEVLRRICPADGMTFEDLFEERDGQLFLRWQPGAPGAGS